jgi:hypothetical protein
MSPAAIVSAPQGRDALPWFDRDGVADFSFSATSMFELIFPPNSSSGRCDASFGRRLR